MASTCRFASFLSILPVVGETRMGILHGVFGATTFPDQVAYVENRLRPNPNLNTADPDCNGRIGVPKPLTDK
jgi:hypothetical protein